MGQPDMSQIIAQAQEMQRQLQEAQQRIVETTRVGESPNGLVKATINGAGKISDIVIDPSIVDPEDVDTLQDLVVAAINDAHRRITDFAAETMGPLSNQLQGSPFGNMMG